MNNQRNTLTRWIAPAALALAGAIAMPAQAADVAVSIGFSQPGVYGRVDIGRYPQPVLIAPQPVYVGPPVYREPVYLWVPPGHRRDWRHHCREYNACGAPVYFVQDGWYRQNVVVRHERERDWRRDDRRRDDWRDDHRGDRDHDHGRGHRD